VTAAVHARSRVAALAVAALAGALFGAGLVISGMTQPARIAHFLDPLHGWDPSLAFVMAGAVAVYATGHAWTRRRLDRPCAHARQGDAIGAARSRRSHIRPRSIPFQYSSGSAYTLRAYMLYRSWDWSNGNDSTGLPS
jgi:uncharacterized membrane protein YedE/YeeE